MDFQFMAQFGQVLRRLGDEADMGFRLVIDFFVLVELAETQDFAAEFAFRLSPCRLEQFLLFLDALLPFFSQAGNLTFPFFLLTVLFFGHFSLDADILPLLIDVFDGIRGNSLLDADFPENLFCRIAPAGNGAFQFQLAPLPIGSGRRDFMPRIPGFFGFGHIGRIQFAETIFISPAVPAVSQARSCFLQVLPSDCHFS